MQLIKKRDDLANICFYIGMAIHLLVMVIGYSDFEIPYAGRLLQIAFVFLCLKIVMTYYSVVEWGVLVGAGALGAASYVFTGDEYVVSVIVMVFACKNADMVRFLKIVLWTSLLATVIIAVLSVCGVGGMAVDIRNYGRGGTEARWCFGFGHANNFHGTLWYLMMLLVVVYFEKIKWYHYLGMTVVNLVFYFMTVSRGGFLAAQIVITAGLLFQYIPQFARYFWVYLLGVLALLGVVALSIASAMIPFNEYPILAKLDGMLTGRLQLVYRYADMGQWKILSTGVVTDMIDNGFVTTFFRFGYVIGILFIGLHVYLLYKAWKTRNGVLLIMIVTSVFYTFMESSYTMNSVYLLSNVSYIAAMLLVCGTYERSLGYEENY